MRSEIERADGVGLCENCQRKHVPTRGVQTVGMFKEGRGFFRLCFDCFPHQRFWTARDGRHMRTPVYDKPKEPTHD